MKVKNLNNSSLKTKEAIRTAFAEMVKEKQDLNKITVTELVRRAISTVPLFIFIIMIFMISLLNWKKAL